MKKTLIEVTPEDREDLFKLLILLKNATLTVNKTYYEKQQNLVKRKQKKVVKQLKMDNLVPLIKESNKPPVLQGTSKGKVLKLTLQPAEKLRIQKKFSFQELDYLRSQRRKSVPYMAVEPGRIVLGQITQKKFVQTCCKYFNFKETSYVKEVLKVLGDLLKLNTERVLKCSRVFVPTLTRYTSLNWLALENDALLDWKSHTKFVKEQQQLLREYVTSKHLTTRDLDEALVNLQEGNVTKIVLTERAPLDLYRYLFLQNTSIDVDKKVHLMNYSERIHHVVPQGFLLIRYFNPL